MKTGVLLPIVSKKEALQYFVISLVTSKYPHAPAPIKIIYLIKPLAWTTRSGILSLSN